MLTPIQEAFIAWAKLMPCLIVTKSTTVHRPGPLMHKGKYFEHGRNFVDISHWDGACCEDSHFKAVQTESTGVYHSVAKTDAEVCPRERAWRKYIRLRDDQANLAKGK